MHSELHGAAVCIVKNPSGRPVPALTLYEAATFEMCHSPCWENKVTSQVYWVNANQVSKTPPTGMFIGTGSFIIRGKRNFLQPQRLELGFTLMFCVSEESLFNHIGERNCREDLEELESALQLERAESQLTAEDAEQEIDAASASGDWNNENKITIVQVGEKDRFQNKQDDGRFNKQASNVG